MRQSDRNKRGLIIIGLCSIAIIMAVGFAAFAQRLQINSTSEVTSSWDVHIKTGGVSYKNAVEATSTLAEKTSDLVATFACQLVTPGVSTISYDVVVENKGSLNAKLDSINLTGGNTAISVGTSPTNASLSTNPIVLAPNDETTITVTVSYNDINTQPTGDGLTTNITAQLNFSQTNDSPAPVAPILHTVYAYHTDAKRIGEGIVTDGVSNYSSLSSYQSGNTWFLKYELDENNVIQNAWACMKFDFISDPICMRGDTIEDSTETSQYWQGNEEILSGFSTAFSQQDGGCYDSTGSDGEASKECKVDYYDGNDDYIDTFSIDADSVGNVSSGTYNHRCYVQIGGRAECY